MTETSAATVTRSAAWRAFEATGTEVISFAIFTLMARLLAPEQFSHVAISGSIILLLSSMLNTGLPQAMVQQPQLDDTHIRAAFAASIGFAVLLTIATMILIWPLSRLLSRPDLPVIYCALAPLLIVHGVNAPMHALLRRSFGFRAIALRMVSVTLIGGVVGLLAARAGFGAWSLVLQQWTGMAIGMVVLMLTSPVKPWQLRYDRAALSPLWRVARPVLVGQLMTQSARRLDLLLLGIFLGDHEVGTYSLVSRLVHSVNMVTLHSIEEVSFVALSRLRSVPVRHRAAIRRVIRFTTFACLLCFCGLVLLAPDILPMLFGAAWADAVEPLQWLCGFAVFGGLVSVCGSILVSGGHAREAGKLAATVALTQLIFVAFTAPHGLVATAIGINTAQLLVLVPAMLLVSRHFQIAPLQLAKDVLPMMVCGACAFAIAHRFIVHTPMGMAMIGAFFTTMMIAAGAVMFRSDLAGRQGKP
jgi:O-antigen/teichoic acid export membrane protein